jgi:hypothetical protein
MQPIIDVYSKKPIGQGGFYDPTPPGLIQSQKCGNVGLREGETELTNKMASSSLGVIWLRLRSGASWFTYLQFHPNFEPLAMKRCHDTHGNACATRCNQSCSPFSPRTQAIYDCSLSGGTGYVFLNTNVNADSTFFDLDGSHNTQRVQHCLPCDKFGRCCFGHQLCLRGRCSLQRMIGCDIKSRDAQI